MLEKPISNELVDLLADGADLAVELAEGLPVIGQAVKAAKLYRSVRDALFVKQVQNFLRELDKVPQETRNAFVQKLYENDEAQRFGAAVTLLLSQLDNLEKSTIIGRLYAAAILGKIEQYEAERVSVMVSRMYIDDRHFLEMLSEESYIAEDTIHSTLAAIGLLKVVHVQQSTFYQGNTEGARYKLSGFGEILLKNGLVDAAM